MYARNRIEGSNPSLSAISFLNLSGLTTRRRKAVFCVDERKMNLIKASFIGIFLIPCVHADNDLVKILEGTSSTPAISGLQISTIKNGEVSEHFTFGNDQAEAHNLAPLRLDHRIRVASVSKIAVAIAVLILVEEGHFSLDDDVSELLGWEFRNPHFPLTPITVRSLLSHTSSVRDGTRYFIAVSYTHLRAHET